MKRLLFLAGVSALIGCSSTDKSRHVSVDGVYANGMAFGSVDVQAAPSEGNESAMISYKDEADWFKDEKNHDIQILLAGSNSVQYAQNIVSNICSAFILTAPYLKGRETAVCKCGTKADCKCDPCKCGAREPEDKSEEPPPQELPSI